MLLFFDTETGGLDPQRHSLLTAHFVAVDEATMEVRGERSLRILSRGIVTEEALRINRIDLEQHMLLGAPREEAAQQLRDFLLDVGGAEQRLTPVGWNVGFDVGFVKAQLLAEWEAYVSYRVLDVQSVAGFLASTGVLPKTNGLAGLANYFGLDTSGHHDAREDTYLTLRVYERLRDLVLPR